MYYSYKYLFYISYCLYLYILLCYRATIPEEEQKEIFAEVYSQLHQQELSKKKSKRIRTFVKPKKSA